MSARPTRVVLAVVLALAATWFVARPAFPSPSRDDARRWLAPLRDGPFDLVADTDGVVVTTSAHSVDALDAQGRVRWRIAVGGLSIGQPALGPGLVVVGSAGSVTALERSDGSRRWSRPRVGDVRSLAVAGDSILVGDSSGTLASLDAADGHTRWSVQHPGVLATGARVDPARRVVVAAWHRAPSPAVRAFDLATGALRWEAPTDRSAAAPVVHDGRVVLAVGDGRRHARVEARDLLTGSVLWQVPVPASFEEAIEPAADDHLVAVVDHFGVVSAIDPATGRLRWQRDLAEVLVAGRVLLTPHRVALTSDAGVLHVLDRRDGHEVQRLTPARLGGLPVAVVRAPWSPRGALLALRLHDWGVQLRRLP